jgi:hypothetical protein
MMSEFEALLRKSLERRVDKPLQAALDLNAITAELSAAIGSVTRGRIRLVLCPLKPKPADGPSFALILRLPHEEEVILRVIVLADEVGYPVKVWMTYEGWDTQFQQYPESLQSMPDQKALRDHFSGFIDGPRSPVVRIIDNQLAVMQDETGTLAGSAAN